MKIYCSGRHGKTEEEILDWLLGKDIWVTAQLDLRGTSPGSIRVVSKQYESEYNPPIYGLNVVPMTRSWLSNQEHVITPRDIHFYCNYVRFYYLPKIHLVMPLDMLSTEELFNIQKRES